MLTELEREMLKALKAASMMLAHTEYNGSVALNHITRIVARAEAKERETAQQAHERMIALRQAETPDDGSYLR